MPPLFMLSANFSAAGALLAIFATIAGAAEMPQCPVEMGAGGVAVRPAPGWTGVAPSRLPLTGASLVVGRPDIIPRAELRGDPRQIGKRSTETTYPSLASREKWLVCSYGRGGEIEQAQRLPDYADRCVIRVAENQYGDTSVKTSCTEVGRPLK